MTHAARAMGAKFHGTLEQLKEKLSPLALAGEWEEQPNGVWKFCCRDRTGLLWSQTKGTVWCDGPPALNLTQRVEALLNEGASRVPDIY